MKVKHLAIIIIAQIIIILNTVMLFNLDNDNYYTFNNVIKLIDGTILLTTILMRIVITLSEIDWDKKL